MVSVKFPPESDWMVRSICKTQQAPPPFEKVEEGPEELFEDWKEERLKGREEVEGRITREESAPEEER